MKRVLQYIIHEVKEGRLSKPGAVELTRELRAQGSLEKASILHPPLHRNTSDLSLQQFSARLSGNESYLRLVDGSHVLPDVAHLEMARAAVEASAGEDGRHEVRLEQVEWLRSVVVEADGLDLHVELFADDGNRIGYEIYSGAAGGEDRERVIHSQGWAVVGPAGIPANADVAVGLSTGTVESEEAIESDIESETSAKHAFDILQTGTVPLTPVWERVAREAGVRWPSPADLVVIAGGTLERQAALRRHYPDAQQLEMPPGAAPELIGDRLRALGTIDHIVWLAPEARLMSLSDDALIAGQQQGVMQCFYLIKALLGLGYGGRQLGWTIITTQAQAIDPYEAVNPTHASVHGLVGSMAKEYPKWRIRLVDAEADRELETSEIFSLPPDRRAHPWVCRDRVWYQHQLIRTQFAPPHRKSLFRTGGVYVVIGGAGAVGQLFSEYLVRAYRAQIVWIGRREKDAAIQAKLDHLAALGCAGQYISADAADRSALQRACEEVKQQYDKIHGVVHAAMVFSSHSLEEIDEQQFKAALSAKVDVSVRIAQVFEHEPLDFVLFFSSLISFIKNPKQSHYASGCTFKDAFAGQLAQKWSFPVRTMNWGYWGQSFPRELAEEMRQAGLGFVDPAIAMRSLENLLVGPLNQLGLISTTKPIPVEGVSLSEWISIRSDGTPTLIERLPNSGNQSGPDAFRTTATAGQKGHVDHSVSHISSIDEKDELLGKVQALLVQEVSRGFKLKPEDIGLDHELSEYGFDSISFTALAHQLNQAYGLELMPTMFFEHPTLGEVAGHLVEHHRAVFAARFAPAARTAVVEDKGPSSHSALDTTPIVGEGELLKKVQELLIQEVSRGFKLKPEDISLDHELSEYGFDSISFTALAHQLNQAYGLELMPTMFFEHPTLGEVAGHLVEHHRAVFAARFAPAVEPAAAPPIVPNAKNTDGSVQTRPRRMQRSRSALKLVTSERTEPATDAVAVIGMSGRFPMAEDVAGLWRNLAEGRDCITEIPRERWDWRAVDGDPLKQVNKTNVKWGGFIDGIGEFDPLFFGISPREAELMDPQQRLMMTYIWKAIEDAGYSAASLAGSRTAILVGVGNSGYGRLIMRAHAALDSYGVTGLLPSVGPNRMSYFLDLHGPSEPIETACSSSLVAVHRAMQALASDSCELAIAGGVNTLLTPDGHISLSRAGMLSVDGRCKTFSRHANGYARGEGVGMLVLKKLHAAERDGDHIYGVIRGSAENHGGRAQSLTAPNPKAQAELLKAAYSRAGIDPRTVGYIEAHGTGTELGDPIEINGLKSAFKDLMETGGTFEASGASPSGPAYCGLGTVKSNIGHLEFAAGVAGLIKVLLQLQHKTLVKSLHCEELNPYIRLEDSPFYIVRKQQDWRAPQDAEGRDLPRRAGISSFGVGGSNAHVVIEEYVAPGHPCIAVSNARPALVVLSAKNAERLKQQVEQLVDAIEQRSLGDANLADVAYTLQVGRDAMECRLGCVVDDFPQLCTRLRAWLNEDKPVENLYQGQVRQHKDALELFTGDELEETIGKWLERGKHGKLLDLWVKGLSFDWQRLYGEAKPRRISLPTYPFARERYWVEASIPSEGEQEEVATAIETPGQSAAAAEAFELLTFEEMWEAQALPAPSNRKMQRVVCLLSDAQSQRRVVEVLKQLTPHTQVIFVAQDAEPDSSPASCRDAFSRIKAAHGEVNAVLYLWGLEDAGCAHDAAIPVHLLQGLASSGLKCGRLLLAGAYNNELSRSHLESWIGFERSLGLVWPQTRVAVIGQEQGLEVEQWLPLLWAELGSERFESAFYRDGLREVCRVRPRALESVESPLRMGGTYLISGGCGGLGLLVAEHLARKFAANLILTGRSALDDAKRQAIARLEALGSAVEYAQADVCDRAALDEALQAGELRFGALHGVIHAAGIGGSGSVFEKDVERFNAALAPKITGTLVLDEVLGDRPLDFVCYFSSSSAQLGDFGSCDYAIGNRFLMAHAHARNALQARGERQGRAVVINWGLWQDGGMGVGGSEQTRMYLKSSGQRALTSVEGIEMFERLLGQSAAQHLVLVGQPSRVHRFLGLGQDEKQGRGQPQGQIQTQGSVASKRSSGGAGRYQGNRAELKGLSVAQCVAFELTGHVSALVKLPRERLDAEENLADFGLDSIGLAELARRLTQQFGVEISPSVFFSHPTLAQLTQYFVKTHVAVVEALYQEQEEAAPLPAPEASPVRAVGRPIEAPPLQPQQSGTAASVPGTGMPEPIAIIGMSGRFPKARTVQEMWRILEAGEDAVEEIPSDRFDWRKVYGDPQREPGKTDCKWGGFVPGVGEFDPLFFEISPREAEVMDPRQRLLLMESWKALEDAGYGASQLGGGKVGMFVGVEQGDYQILTRGSGNITANHDGILASRLGYFLNLRGPTMAINTACSSALVALHQACSSLRNGECDTALAAGVNLILTPMMHIGTSQAGMLSKDGKCRAFDRGANGMVPGEAVAVVVLKRLSRAQADGDPIHAVIRGSGINYDGKTNGITAPSGASQSSLLQDVYERHGVNPADIEYIVTHGTGTVLGDPVEVNALNEAFKSFTQRQGFCALTSSKANFGHTLAASGLVSLIGLVQSFRHETIPASLHCMEENDYIDWQASAFYVNKASKAWPEKTDGRSRIGAVSAFGMSGTNAHVVVESYRPLQAEDDAGLQAPCYLLALSAKTEAALAARIEQLITLLEQPDSPGLPAMSHTLLCGRQHFGHRCAIVIEDREAALYGLRQAIKRERTPNLFQATVARHFSGQKTLQLYGNELLTRCDALRNDSAKYRETLCTLADLYCQGYALDWQSLHASATPRRISLPTYPFATERYWVEASARPAIVANGAGGAMLHPLLHRNTSDLSAQRFSTRLSGEEAYLRGVNGARVLAEVAHLEMARAAVAAAAGEDAQDGMRLEQVEWLQPVVVGSDGLDLHVELFAEEDGKTGYEIYSGAAEGDVRLIHSHGWFSTEAIQTEEAAESEPQTEELLHTYPQQIPSMAAELQVHHKQLAQGEPPEGRADAQEIDELAGKLLWSQLIAAGFPASGKANLAAIKAGLGLHGSYDRWLQASLRILVERGTIAEDGETWSALDAVRPEAEASWEQWEARKVAWLRDPVVAARVGLVETTLRALPGILTGATRATDVMFPNGSLALVEGVYKNNPVADYFNEAVAGMVVSFVEERIKQAPSARIRILEVGAGTGGTSAPVLARLKSYTPHIEDYCYTDLSQAFLLHAQAVFGPDHPYLTYGIFNVEKPISGQTIDAGSYDLVIATNVLHATRDIHRTLRNVKAALRTNGLLLLNEISCASLFTHLTFGLLEGWWLFEDEALRIPGCPGLFPETWREVLGQEGFRSIFFPVADVHALGQQIVVAESDGVVRQVRAAPKARRKTSGLSAGQERKSTTDHSVLRTGLIDAECDLLKKVQASLLQEVSKLIKIKVEALDIDSELSEYGFDSISFTALAHQLNQAYGLELMPTMFFEHPTLGEVARHLVQHHHAVFAAKFAPSAEPAAAPQIIPDAKDMVESVQARPRRMRRGRSALKLVTSERTEPATDAVAVIGMSGRFPMADDVAGLWRNLVEGRDCMVEIPGERWDWRAVDGDPFKEANKTNVKWGGFIDGIGEFDPLFFGISPREAELMDPSQRLLMTYVWKAIEDAGYSAASLAGSRTAILVGVGNSGYGRLIARAGTGVDSYSVIGLMPSTGPNRVSYFLDLHGPSEPIETACSSSLVAVHRAMQALAGDSCELAIAGGVNTMLMPDGHIGLSKAGMLSVDGRCKAFSKHANGYARGEGVGMLVLKKLKAAERDGDHIYGVIRGSAENHGGRAQSLTAPNPKAQAELLKAAYSRAGIDPRTVGYIEAHGTGTVLGDPIEINGLKSAFRDLVETSGDSAGGPAYCGLGTVKSNIGHLELAAGVAGMIKVLVQLQHKTLVKSLHCEELNPYIQLEDSPFYIVREKQDWQALQDAQGHDLPRRAGVSSFGAGGSNAHVVIEEYVASGGADTSVAVSNAHPALVLLSAKNAERLREQAGQLVDAIEQRPLGDVDLADVAYTLQVGRDAMECRLAVIAGSMAELKSRLQSYLAGGSGEFYRGEIKRDKETLTVFAADEDMAGAIEAWVTKGKYGKLLELWVKGLSFDWQRLYGEAKPRRISLPTYPFARERYWVEASMTEAIAASAGAPEDQQEDVAASIEASGPGEAAAGAYELLTFEEVWQAQALPAASNREMQRLVCLLSDAQSQRRVVESIHKLDPHTEVIFVAQDAEPDSSPASCRDAFSRIKAAHGEVDAVLYLWGLEDAVCAQDPAIPMHLLQGLASSGLKCGRLLLVGAYNNELSRSHLESWIGFERSLGLVWPQTQLAVIGHEAGLEVEQWLPLLWGELASERFESAFYRDGRREVCRVRSRALESVESPLRMGGTYLISGGCGGLGLLVAEHLARKFAANLILLGRSGLDDVKRQAIARLEALGAAVEYAQADVCDRAALEEALQAGELRFGALHGVIHAAGVGGSGSVFAKDVERFNAVLAPKIAGTLVLDEVLGDRLLDFVCYFSSSAAQLGDFGACDYAIGNRFLMAHAHVRNALQARGERQGKAVVINWGLWQDGGMGVGGSEQTRMYLKSSGQRALTSSEGIEMFERLLGQTAAQHLVLAGQAGRVHRFLGLGQDEEQGQSQGQSQGSGATAKRSADRAGRYQGVRAELKGLSVAQCVSFELTGHVSALLKLPRERLDAEENLADFGLDSIGLAELARRLTQHFGVEISPSVFFSHPTLAQLTRYFVETHAVAVEALYREPEESAPVAVPGASPLRTVPKRIQAPPLQPSEHPAVASAAALNTGVPEPIAIIGMSGRFPKARTVEEMWRILEAGEDAVEEIPSDRFDWRKVYGDPQREPGKTDCKWGGFVPGVGEFDPLFFEISPREAELMDPRQRLLLMESWKALEDAGYGASQLGGGKVGMFVGVEQGDYQILTRGGGSVTANHDGILASRLGYFLNMRGPAMAINTACSSGLVALHQACMSLRTGECDAALAAGVNLMLTPMVHIGTSQAGMLSKDGKCRAFDRGANGMVPGEAVAVVVLKRLSQAEADGDPIRAVIRGSGINYDGKTNGITAPSGASQSSLLREVYDRHGVDAEKIEYIVTHGTGTKLGDPVEVNALSDAFKSYTQRQGFCALTSSKSNFGHTLAASGLVSLIGLVQSLRHGIIPASLHCAEENDYIDWQASPFYVNKANKAWPEKTDGRRLGAVSAFGMSGTNAHVVVESYQPPQAEDDAGLKAPCYLLALSARTEAALAARIEQLIAVLEQPDSPDLPAMSHTLLCGRQHFGHRCAIVAEDREAASYALKQAACRERLPNLFQSTVARHFSGQKAMQLYGDELLTRCDGLLDDPAKYQETLCALADLYCQGYSLDWQNLHASLTPRRIPLPTYPFARQRYWFEAVARADGATTPADVVHEKLDDLVEATLPPVIDAGPLAPGMDLTAEVRAALSQWMCELLKIPDRDIDPENDLTQYGLDSISSVQLVNRINKTYRIELPPTTFFEHPTLAGFARYLVEDHGAALAAGHERSSGVSARGEIRNEPTLAVAQSSSSQILTSSRSRRNAATGQLQASLANEVAQHPRKSFLNGASYAFSRPQRAESPPLSYMQENLLLMHQRANVGSAYHVPMSFRLVGSLDTAALQASLTEVVRRHESLRTRFSSADDGAVQVIEPPLAVELPIVDLQHLAEDKRADEARRLSAEWLQRPFDLEVAPLFRVGVIRLRPAEQLLVIVAHHLVIDGWSMELLIREVSALYSAFSRGLPSPLQSVSAQYADYAIWQKQQVQERILDRELNYWIDRLVDAPLLELPTDRPRPPAPSYRGSTVLFNFPERDVAALRGLAQREGVSLFTVLFAAFNIVLFRWSGQEDIVVGTPVAGRRLLEFENSIGFFTNWLALRNDLSGAPTFRELLQRVKDTSLSALAHQDLPLVRIEAEIKSMRDLSRHPLFRVLLGLQRVSPGAAFTGLDASPVYIENNTSRRDLCFFLYEMPDALFGIFEYATDLFDASTIERTVGEFRAVLYQMLAEPDGRIDGCNSDQSAAHDSS